MSVQAYDPTQGYKLSILNNDHINEFNHREVVFTRLKLAGNGKTTPLTQVIQVWDAKTDELIMELQPDFEDSK